MKNEMDKIVVVFVVAGPVEADNSWDTIRKWKVDNEQNSNALHYNMD
jgi:hypothetical protein